MPCSVTFTSGNKDAVVPNPLTVVFTTVMMSSYQHQLNASFPKGRFHAPKHDAAQNET